MIRSINCSNTLFRFRTNKPPRHMLPGRFLFFSRLAIHLGQVTQSKGDIMNKKLYVGNLAYSVTDSALRELFSSSGVVTSVSIITERETGRSKGFAFVEMESENAAKKAIGEVNGKLLDDRAITVAEARPQAPRSGSGTGFGYGDRGSGFGRGNRTGGAFGNGGPRRSSRGGGRSRR